MKITLLCGGVSPERDISLASGMKIAEALRSRGHSVCVVDPAYGYNQPDEKSLFSFSVSSSPPSYNGKSGRSKVGYIEAVDKAIPSDTDVVFIILHGTYGEDGVIQSLIELKGLPYTGSGVLASALAMDKSVSKILFKTAGIPVPSWLTAENDGSDTEILIKEFEKKFGFPSVIKPNDQGSTVGLTIIRSVGEVEDALAAAWKYSKKIIVEAYIHGREMTVPIVGKEALPVIEIKPKSGFYDYRHKYTPGETEYIIPAEIEESIATQLQKLSLNAFNVLGCRGFARVDLRLDNAGNPYILEVNTLPGMMDTSLLPKAAKAAGIDYPVLCERIVKLALENS